jgi:NADPH:quinone reductase
MKVYIINAYGKDAVFTPEDRPIPTPMANEVLIKVAATNINPIDAKIRAGLMTNVQPPLPAVLHTDMSGVVVACGEQVTDYQEGDEVYGCIGGIANQSGALAEYVVVSLDMIAKKPSTLSLSEAATIPLVGITAYIALFEKLMLTSDNHVLIHAGLGGVGNMACQFAHAAGAKVSATVGSDDDAELLHTYGVAHAINYKKELPATYKLLASDSGFSHIFDTVGTNNLIQSFEAAATHGRIACTQTLIDGIDLSIMHKKGLTLSSVLMLDRLIQPGMATPYCHYLKKITALIEEFGIKPHIDKQTFLVKDLADAYRHIETRQSSGKVVITVG